MRRIATTQVLSRGRFPAAALVVTCTAFALLAWSPGAARAAHPFSGAPVVYVGLEDLNVPEEGFVGIRPAGLRAIRLGRPRTEARRLTDDPTDTGPAVSPDGRLIAFSRRVGAGGDAHAALFLFRRDGSGLRRLTDGGPAAADDIEPSFAPSGRRLLFVRLDEETTPGGNEGDVYSIRIDGAGLHRITAGRSADRSPVLSPDRRQVAFARRPFRRAPGGRPEWGRSHVYSIRPDGSRLRDLTPRIPAPRRGRRAFDAADPAFAPSSRTIAFAAAANGGEEIFAMRRDGRRSRPLTGAIDNGRRRAYGFSQPAFSRSGRFLLLTARERTRVELVVADRRTRRLQGSGSALEGEAAAWLSR